MVTDAKGPLDEDVDAVDEAAADILQRQADAEGGGAENGGDRGPAGAEDRQDDGAAQGVDAKRRGPAQQGGNLGVDSPGHCGSPDPAA